MTIRAIRRVFALAFVLALSLPRLWSYRLRGQLTLERRALWAQTTARQIMVAMGIRAKVTGDLPERGLLVSNHLGYLDILIYGAIVPCFFVSKSEIARWPFFGWMSKAAGTIFVERSGRARVESVVEQMAERFKLPMLKRSVMVLLFPEGTSTDGSRVLPFRSRLFSPAIDFGVPITPAAVRYIAHDTTAERELCWFGDAEFLPHLLKTLGCSGVIAEVHFGAPNLYADRRVAAVATRTEIEILREASAVAVQEIKSAVTVAQFFKHQRPPQPQHPKQNGLEALRNKKQGLLS